MRLFCLFLFAFSDFLLPKSFFLLDHGEFVVGYDARTRSAAWVYEQLTVETVERGQGSYKKRGFAIDPLIPAPFRAHNLDYLGAGFDRGHLCPCSDLSPRSASSSFYLSNISPQHPQFNRGIWKRLEKHIRGLVRENSTLHVITLPLFLPEEKEEGKWYVFYRVLGKNRVAVPTHFAKAIFLEKEGEVDVICYLLPNSSVKEDRPLEDFFVSLELLERLSGVLLSEVYTRFGSNLP